MAAVAGDEYELSRFLSEKEIADIGEPVRQKLDSFVRDVKADIEKMRVVSEQQCFDLERQLQESNQGLNACQKSVDEHAESRTALEEKLKSCTAELEDKKQTASAYQKQLEESQHQNDLLSTEKKDLLAMMDKRIREIETLNEELKVITKQLSATMADKFKALAKVDELTSEDTILRQHANRVQQERDSLVKQVESLNTEVSQNKQRLYAARSEQGHKQVELQGKLDEVAEQLRQTISVKETFQTIIDEQTKRLDEQLLQIKDLKENNIRSEQQFQHQLQVQAKLADLYKCSADEGQGRVKELTTAIEEMQALLRQADVESKDHEREVEEERQARLKLAAEKDKVIAALKIDLGRAEKLLEQARKHVLSEEEISGISPSAAAASRLLRSGKSLTEIYAEYVDAADQLQSAREDNNKLTMYLEQILKEIEVKAPALVRQREEYEKALETITHLSSRLNEAVLDHEKMHSELADTRRKNVALLKKEEELENSIADFGQQVCALLREVEEAKGRKIADFDDRPVVSSSSSASRCITDNLVTFRDLQELQGQNRKLLAVVRELGEKHERESRDTENQKLAEIKKELKSAHDEVEQLRSARDRQKEAVDAIARQRDMYCTLLNQANQNILRDSESSATPVMASTPLPVVRGTASPQGVSFDEHAALKTAFQQLQDELSRYKSESNDNNKLMNEQLEKLKNERMELRLHSAKLSAKLEFANERCSTARSNVDACKKEISALVARNQQVSELVGRHEESVSVLRNELMRNQEKLAKSEVSLENLRLEHSLIRDSETRLKTENEILRREQCGQNLLMANLQAIQNNLEKSDVEAKMQSQSRIVLLEKELLTSKKTLEREVERGRAIIVALETEKREIFDKYQVEIESHIKTKDELVNSYGILHTARQEALATEEKLKAMISKDSTDATRPRPVKLARPGGLQMGDKDEDEMSLLLAEAQSEAKALRAQLEQSQQHLEQFKSMSSSLEDQIREQSETATKLKCNTDKLLKEKQDEIANMKKELERLKSMNDLLTETNTKRTAHDVFQVDNLKRELAAVRLELNTVTQEAKENKRNEEIARKDLHEQSVSVEEAKVNYQRELMLHASDIQALEKLRSELAGYEARLSTSREAAQKAEFAFRNGQESWQSREIVLKSKVDQLTPKCEELERQNRLLHDQMEKMSDQMIALQSKTFTVEKASSSSSSDAVEVTSSEHLLELIKYLRREREITTTKCEVASSECQRLASKLDFLQARLEEANNSLADVQQKDEAGLSTSAQHAELLRKVELLNVLTDGNRILREEKDKIHNQLTTAEEKLTKLETEITPLQEQNQELSTRCEALQAERRALEGEARRWQIRTQQLTGMRSEKESVQSELKSAQDSVARLTEELASCRTQIEELSRTAMQVRKIGRKYKAQYDELKVQYDELLVKYQESESLRVAAEKTFAEVAAKPEVTGPSVAEAVAVAKQEVKQEMEVKIKNLEESVKSSEDKSRKLKQSACQRILGLQLVRDQHLKEIENLKTKLVASEQAQQTDISAAIQAKSTLESHVKELESALEESRTATRTATQEKSNLQKDMETLTQKVASLNKHIDTLQARLKENTNIKLAAVASSSRESSILSQSGLEGTPPTANIKPMATMPGSSTVRHAHPVNQPSRQTPMGRIRPITPFSQSSTRMAAVTPTTQQLSQQQQQQQQQQHDISEAESSLTMMTSSTNVVSCVPQAAIAPTPAVHAVAALNSTATAASVTLSEGSSPQHHHQVVTFTEPTSNTVEETDVDVTSDDAPQDLSVVGSSTDTLASSDDNKLVPHASEMSSEVITPGSGVSDATLPKVVVKRLRIEVENSESVTKRVKIDVGELAGPSVSSVVCAPAVDESSEIQTDETVSTTIGSEIAETVAPPKVPVSKVAHEETELEVILVESDEEGEEVDGGSKAYEGEEADNEEDDVNVYEATMDEIIVGEEGNLSTEEVEDVEESGDGRGGGSGGDDDEVQVEGQDATAVGDDYDTVEFPDDEGEKMDEEQEAEEMVDDDVEIIEQEENVENVEIDEDVGESGVEIDERQPLQVMDDRSGGGDIETTSSEPMEQQQQPPPPPQPIIVQPLAIPSQRQIQTQAAAARMTTQRLPTLSRGQQPAPFPTMGANTSGGFEDGDSIVPSTPTLFDPRRNDGFAEAVSSPQVPPERFLFSSSVSETPSQLASQGALGVDDTRMDLSQLEESSGRSVPSTPLQVSPPDTLQEASAFAGVSEDAVPSIIIQDVTGVVREFSEAVLDVDASVTDAQVCIVEEPPEAQAEQIGNASSSTGPLITEVTLETAAGSQTLTTSTATSGSPPVTTVAMSGAESRRATSGQPSRQPRPFSNNRGSSSQRGNYHNQRRATPIVWDHPLMNPDGGGGGGGRGVSTHHHGMPFGRDGNGSGGGGGGGQNRPYARRMRVMGHPMQMRMNRPFQRGSGSGNRGQRYPRMNR